MEQNAPTMHVQRRRPAVVSVTLQVTHRLVGIGNLNHRTAVRAHQVQRHNSMIDLCTVDRPESQAPTHAGPTSIHSESDRPHQTGPRALASTPTSPDLLRPGARGGTRPRHGVWATADSNPERSRVCKPRRVDVANAGSPVGGLGDGLAADRSVV